MSGALIGSQKTKAVQDVEERGDEEHYEQQQGSVHKEDEAEKEAEPAGNAEQLKSGWFGTKCPPKPADTAKADVGSKTLSGSNEEDEKVEARPRRGWFGRKPTPKIAN